MGAEAGPALHRGKECLANHDNPDYDEALLTQMHARLNALIEAGIGEDIGNSRLFNYTYPDPTLGFELDFGVQDDTDIVRMRQILKGAVNGVGGVLSDKPIEALFIEFGDKGLIYRVRWWVDTYTDPYPIYDKVDEAMYTALGREGIKVTFTT